MNSKLQFFSIFLLFFSYQLNAQIGGDGYPCFPPTNVINNLSTGGQTEISSGNGDPQSTIDDIINTSGVSTEEQENPYWQIDLGLSAFISSIEIYHNNLSTTQFLQNFFVFVSDNPFGRYD